MRIYTISDRRDAEHTVHDGSMRVSHGVVDLAEHRLLGAVVAVGKYRVEISVSEFDQIAKFVETHRK